MILEIDYGNTRLKWRLLDALTSDCIARGAVNRDRDILPAVQPYLSAEVTFCRVCSVRLAVDNTQLLVLLEEWFKVTPVFAVATESLGGLVSGYHQPERLGVDRWLAAVAAFQTIKNDCVVIDCGTAITVDYIRVDGAHLGGCIAPGLKMMIDALTSNAQQLAGSICMDAVNTEELCGKDTSSAISCGVMTMLRGFIREQLDYAASVFAAGFQVVYTGGDSSLVVPDLKDAVLDEDLVFKGLAIACPYHNGV